jgi:tetratricopeptide (TPR) repeat protein
VCLCWLANCFSDLGQNQRGIESLEQALEINRKVDNRKGEAICLGNLGALYSEVGQSTRAIDFHKQALLIDREIVSRSSEAGRLVNLGKCYKDIGRPDEALQCHTEVLVIVQAIGYRGVEAASHSNMGELETYQGKWSEAAREFELAIEIADDIGNPQVSRDARESLALVNIYQNNLAGAQAMAAAAQKFDVTLSNYRSSAVLGVVALRQGNTNGARSAFSNATKEAERLIALTANRYDALDFRGLSLCGLALCREPSQIPAAKAVYSAARAVTSDVGIVHTVLQYFDALAQADTDGILAEVRPFAAGVSQTPQQ